MEYILLEKKDGIALLTIDKEKSLNALDSQVISELSEAVDNVACDKDVNVLIITGKARAFVAGADISYMQPLSVLEASKMAKTAMDVFRKIETLPIPVIAAINGFALGGGCELAMSCDIRLASTKAKLGQPEVGLGITPGYGGTQRLPRLVGMGKAKELIYTADIIDANEAHRIGLVDEVYEPEQLLDEAFKMANKIQSKSMLAVKAAKKAINTGMQVDIDSAMVIEESIFAGCFSTEDQKEGMSAFLEKRQPEFKNK